MKCTSEALGLVRSSGRSVAGVARLLGMSPQRLGNWVMADRGRREREREPGALSETEREELARPREEVGELRMGREVLREAAACLARETVR